VSGDYKEKIRGRLMIWPLTVLNLSTVPERKPLEASMSFPWMRNDGKTGERYI
jgi:hypothetical protein